jgi:hypothetical protein
MQRHQRRKPRRIEISRHINRSWGVCRTRMGRSRLQAPTRRLPHGAQCCNLLSNVMGGHWGNVSPRWTGPLLLGPDTHTPPSLANIGLQLFKPAVQDARSTKLPVSPGPSGSPYIKSPPHRSRSKDQAGQLALGSLPPFTMLDSDFPAMEGASLAPRNPGLLQVRTRNTCSACGSGIGGE